jgi:hypothetical protein
MGWMVSLRTITTKLAARGFVNERGEPFNLKNVVAMLAG